MSNDEKIIRATEGWRVLLPAGWVTIPTEDEAARKVISRLIDIALEGKPRDEMINHRIELDRTMRSQVRKAAEAGADFVHALMKPINDLPVSASLVTRFVPAANADDMASALNMMLGEAEGVVENGYADITNDLGGLRRLRRWQPELDFGDGQKSSEKQMMTCVDYVVPLDSTGVLVLAFSTSTEPVYEELIVLFDAIASTLHRAAPAPKSSDQQTP